MTIENPTLVDYETVIGLEIHVQLRTRSKMFCCCQSEYQTASPNTLVCPVCLALPGALPVINKRAVELTIMTGVAFNCEIATKTKFDRKNYGYPDLMKGYQISQYEQPVASHGHLDLPSSDPSQVQRRIGITRVHLEEDVARLLHVGSGIGAYSLMDVNRAGVPLMEVVSEPDIRSPTEAESYISEVQRTIRYLGVSTANMEEGSFRCDANVSVRPVGSNKLGNRVEIKNMNRIRAVVRALEYEIDRQIVVLRDGGRVHQETRGWDDDTNATQSQRSKEEANDYRYFPEPDLPPLDIEECWVNKIKSGIPELADSRRIRFQNIYRLSSYDASLLTANRPVADYFELVVETRQYTGDTLKMFAKETANWINGELARITNQQESSESRERNPYPNPKHLANLIEMFQSRTINNAAAKSVLAEMIGTGVDPETIIQRLDLNLIGDTETLGPVVDDVIASNVKAVNDYSSGKETALRFLVGQVMKETRGSADPNLAATLIERKLSR